MYRQNFYKNKKTIFFPVQIFWKKKLMKTEKCLLRKCLETRFQETLFTGTLYLEDNTGPKGSSSERFFREVNKTRTLKRYLPFENPSRPTYFSRLRLQSSRLGTFNFKSIWNYHIFSPATVSAGCFLTSEPPTCTLARGRFTYSAWIGRSARGRLTLQDLTYNRLRNFCDV